MARIVTALIAGTAAALLATGVRAESVREAVGNTPFLPVANEPAPRLIVDPPLAEPLSRGAVIIQYRVENARIAPILGAGALTVSPRVAHLHVTVDALPWHWADASDNNTVVVVGLPAGEHSLLLELADPAHHIYPGDTRRTVTFTVPAPASGPARSGSH